MSENAQIVTVSLLGFAALIAVIKGIPVLIEGSAGEGNAFRVGIGSPIPPSPTKAKKDNPAKKKKPPRARKRNGRVSR